MSPIPAFELPDDEPKQSQKPVKGGVDKIKSAAATAEISLPKTVLKGEMPLIRARVLYLGPGENHSISMPGQIHETYLEDPDGTVERRDRDGHDAEGNVVPGKMRHYTVLKEAVPTGITQYDFSTRDTRGHIILERQAPEHFEERYRGRPFAWCEHVGHLRNFFMAKDARNEDLYHIKVNPEQAHLLTEHIRRSERARRQQEALFADVAGR